MRNSGMAKKYVQLVQDMCEGSETVVRCAIGTTKSFGRTAPGISVKSVPVFCDYGWVNGRSKERTTMDDAVC